MKFFWDAPGVHLVPPLHTVSNVGFPSVKIWANQWAPFRSQIRRFGQHSPATRSQTLFPSTRAFSDCVVIIIILSDGCILPFRRGSPPLQTTHDHRRLACPCMIARARLRTRPAGRLAAGAVRDSGAICARLDFATSHISIPGLCNHPDVRYEDIPGNWAQLGDIIVLSRSNKNASALFVISTKFRKEINWKPGETS